MALVSLDGRALDPGSARAMLDAIAHRGDRPPRLWEREGVALGHVSLPTTPEAERELLPAGAANGRYWLTWDGRLDNREELERALGLARRSAEPPTDADYVLAAYERWGDDCVRRLLGDWALVVWDAERRRLFCAKDPLGWRPLCYGVWDRQFVIASEPLALLAGSGRGPEPDREYLHRFLAGALRKRGSTCYDGVYQFDGGERLVLEGDAHRVERYWRPRAGRDPGFRRFEECVDAFESVFAEAVRARMRSNGPVAVALSGGLDSSYIAAAAAGEVAAAPANLRAITLFAPDADLDEREYARQAARPLAIAHHEIDAGDCWGFSSRWLPDEAWDAPDVALPGALSVRLAHATKELGARVLLNGDGGDEWMDADHRASADAVLRGRLVDAWRIAGATRRGVARWRTLLGGLIDGLVPPAAQARVPRLRARVAAPPLAAVVDHGPDWRHPAAEAWSPLWRPQRGHAQLWAYLWRAAGPIADWRERRAFAAHGVELRTPFHDLRVVELMASLPAWRKRPQGRDREILRAAGQRMLPGPLFGRTDKAYFNRLVHAGLQGESERVAAALDRVCREPGVHGVRAREMVERTLERGTMSALDPAPRLISAGLWLQHADRLRATAGTEAGSRDFESRGGRIEDSVRTTRIAGAR
jgi:asparagine synthase (glutamine-hydrolysing)